MKRTIVLGRNAHKDVVTAELELSDDGRFSACFSSWNGKRGHLRDIEHGGQFDPRPEIVSRSVSADLLAEIVRLWERWHLNDMRAGCPHQEAAHWRICQGHYLPDKPSLWPNTLRSLSPTAFPEWLRFVDEDNGIFVTPHIYVTIKNCDGQREEQEVRTFARTLRCSLDMISKPCPTCGYKYGTKWLKEEIPADELEKIRAIMA